MTTQETHYYAFCLSGWSVHEKLNDCIELQLMAHGSCYAVMQVYAPIKAVYSIKRHLPAKYYPDSQYKPGEQVYFLPVAAPHMNVPSDYHDKCIDTTDWTIEMWRDLRSPDAVGGAK